MKISLSMIECDTEILANPSLSWQAAPAEDEVHGWEVKTSVVPSFRSHRLHCGLLGSCWAFLLVYGLSTRHGRTCMVGWM